MQSRLLINVRTGFHGHLSPLLVLRSGAVGGFSSVLIQRTYAQRSAKANRVPAPTPAPIEHDASPISPRVAYPAPVAVEPVAVAAVPQPASTSAMISADMSTSESAMDDSSASSVSSVSANDGSGELAVSYSLFLVPCSFVGCCLPFVACCLLVARCLLLACCLLVACLLLACCCCFYRCCFR